MPKAHEVREILDRFEEQNWDRHTKDSFDTIESFTEQVVEEGKFIPDAKVHADLDLTLSERITGNRQQDMTAFLVMGMMLGSALERDVPEGSGWEEQWRDGDYELPE